MVTQVPRNSDCPRVNAASPLPAPFRLPLCPASQPPSTCPSALPLQDHQRLSQELGTSLSPSLLSPAPPTPSQWPKAVGPTSRSGTPVPRQPGQQRLDRSLLAGLPSSSPVGLAASSSSSTVLPAHLSRTGSVHACDLPSSHRRLPRPQHWPRACCTRASALAASSCPKHFPFNSSSPSLSTSLKGPPPPGFPCPPPPGADC